MATSLAEIKLARLRELRELKVAALRAGTAAARDLTESWRTMARPDQLLPDGDWRVMLWLGGRGSGKTRAGSQGLAELILGDTEPGEWGIVGPTYRDAWTTCIEGESGLLAAVGTTMADAVAGNSQIIASVVRSTGEIRFRNGSIVRADSADDGALRIQGKNLRGVWCLARGEPVLTSCGAIPVEFVRPGMRVWTRKGWRQVTVARMTRRSAPVLRIRTAAGASVRVTADHLVWTQHAGWVEARTLRYGDSLSVWNSPTDRPPGSSGKASAGTAAARVPGITPTALGACCTSPYGNANTASLSPPGMSSTTSTMTWSTTPLRTCSCSPSQSTSGITTSRNRAASPPCPPLTASEPPGVPGPGDLSVSAPATSAALSTHPRASAPCTAHLNAGPPPSALTAKSVAGHRCLSGSVNGAAADSSPGIAGPSTAGPYAGNTRETQPSEREQGHASAYPAVKLAGSDSHLRTAASASAPVPAVSGTHVVSVEPNGRDDVFDLQVDDAHEFTAGGILVHNCDELGLVARWEIAWDESIAFAVRKGSSRIIATGTPKVSRPAAKLIRRLAKEAEDPAAGVVVRHLKTRDNLANLSETFYRSVVARSKGTRLERQELEGELLDDTDGALWTWDVIDRSRVEPDAVPALVRIVVAIDPAVTSGQEADETGIIVMGEGKDGHGYVLADMSMRAAPDVCMQRASAAYHDWQADRVVAEVNNGGDYIGTLLHAVDPIIPYRKVTATRGKLTRAEPLSALYAQGKIHHAGVFPDLEDQMVTWVPGGDDSPDRLDALVWCAADLRGLLAGSWLEAYGMIKCQGCGRTFSDKQHKCPECAVPVAA